MEEQVLSIEQMQELKDLGIDISKASMIWFPKLSLDENKRPFVSSHFIDINRIRHDAYWSTYEGKNSCPTFTLQDILERLPKIITFNDEHEANLILLDNALIYYETSTKMFCLEKRGKNMLEAAFNMIKWLKENNFI